MAIVNAEILEKKKFPRDISSIGISDTRLQS